jgi:hypothetical protein
MANWNKTLGAIIKQRKTNIHRGITYARNNAIAEINQFLDDEFSAYSETHEAHKHFIVRKQQKLLGPLNGVYFLEIKPADEDPPVGQFLMDGTAVGRETYPIVGKVKFGDVQGEISGGVLSFEMQDGRRYYGRGPVNHPSYQPRKDYIEETAWGILYKHILNMTSNKYYAAMGPMTEGGQANPNADFDALED